MMRPAQPSADAARLRTGLAALTHLTRAGAGLSTAELARRADLSADFVDAVEAGSADPDPRQLDQLARGLGLADGDELRASAADTARRIADSTVRPPA